MREVWWANAFVGPEAGGNSTCVVLEDAASSTLERAAIARSLRAPDTAFLTPDPSHGWAIQFYSPEEGEMAFCGQALIAAHAVLRAQGVASAKEPLALSTSAGVVSMSSDSSEAGVSWFAVPRSAVRVLGEADLPPSLLLAPGGQSVLVDSGRARLYRRLDLSEDLAAIALEPEAVLRACSALQIKGLCFYARANDHAIALRVFTISLAGGEDASTGGAVLGLSALLPPGDWTIEQGHGRVLNRGLLRLHAPPAAADTAVGGAVEIVARGMLQRR